MPRMSHGAKDHGEAQHERHCQRHDGSWSGEKPDRCEMACSDHTSWYRWGNLTKSRFGSCEAHYVADKFTDEWPFRHVPVVWDESYAAS